MGFFLFSFCNADRCGGLLTDLPNRATAKGSFPRLSLIKMEYCNALNDFLLERVPHSKRFAELAGLLAWFSIESLVIQTLKESKSEFPEIGLFSRISEVLEFQKTCWLV